ncbi:hypothetical protein LINPERPRIM_LOCUS12744 [Linum perenne]
MCWGDVWQPSRLILEVVLLRGLSSVVLLLVWMWLGKWHQKSCSSG